MKRILIHTLLLCIAHAALAQSHRMVVRLDSSVTQSLTGRLYVFSVTDTTKGVQDPDAFNPTPTFYVDVKNWRGGEARVLDENAAAYPVALDKLKTGYYKFAAVLDVDTLERINTATAGNYYSRDVKAFVQQGVAGETHLYLDKKFPQRRFRESASVKELVLKTALVSAFKQRDAFIKAAIVLPASYATDTVRSYPVVFIIPGWGGSHFDALNPHIAKRYGFGMGSEKIYVYLNPETNTPFGLHAFVDSRVNGPWGKALVQEFIPQLEKQYRVSQDARQRFLVGQSSGGYGALWLHLNYPKAFGGSWAVSPDPVDFRDFTSVNLYDKNANLFYDVSGQERPFFMRNGKPLGTIRAFAQFEDFLGTGGQMQSFEAEFGLAQTDGKPQRMFERSSGKINAAVVNAWKPYDLSLFLFKNYKRLAPLLAGRVHVYAGANDNFFLDRSVRLMQERMSSIKANVKVELIAGADHFGIWSEAFTQRVQAEIEALLAR